jgi:hypothetical protein
MSKFILMLVVILLVGCEVATSRGVIIHKEKTLPFGELRFVVDTDNGREVVRGDVLGKSYNTFFVGDLVDVQGGGMSLVK